MTNQDNTIPCPVCSTKIPFDVQLLLVGTNFACPNPDCDASIGIAQESIPLVEQTLEKLEALKIK